MHRQSDGYVWWALQESNLRPRACEATQAVYSSGLGANFLMMLDLARHVRTRVDSKPPPKRHQDLTVCLRSVLASSAARCDLRLRPNVVHWNVRDHDPKIEAR